MENLSVLNIDSETSAIARFLLGVLSLVRGQASLWGAGINGFPPGQIGKAITDGGRG